MLDFGLESSLGRLDFLLFIVETLKKGRRNSVKGTLGLRTTIAMNYFSITWIAITSMTL
jgi:hypothetical protein